MIKNIYKEDYENFGGTGRVAQFVEYLPNKHEALS
jgi:hypothetical protein